MMMQMQQMQQMQHTQQMAAPWMAMQGKPGWLSPPGSKGLGKDKDKGKGSPRPLVKQAPIGSAPSSSNSSGTSDRAQDPPRSKAVAAAAAAPVTTAETTKGKGKLATLLRRVAKYMGRRRMIAKLSSTGR